MTVASLLRTALLAGLALGAAAASPQPASAAFYRCPVYAQRPVLPGGKGGFFAEGLHNMGVGRNYASGGTCRYSGEADKLPAWAKKGGQTHTDPTAGRRRCTKSTTISHGVTSTSVRCNL